MPIWTSSTIARHRGSHSSMDFPLSLGRLLQFVAFDLALSLSRRLHRLPYRRMDGNQASEDETMIAFIAIDEAWSAIGIELLTCRPLGTSELGRRMHLRVGQLHRSSEP